MGNSHLCKAKSTKNDEFYTLLSTIEEEVKHYKEHFKGKVVFCNCDDPEKSNFWFFFQSKFIEYGLKRLISTHYDPVKKSSYKLEIVGDQNGDGRIDEKDIVKTPLQGVGDFRDAECVELLKQSDIVCTNPPFSLFREYIAQLMEYDKKFLILGDQKASTYKEIFPYIKDEKIWWGCTYPKVYSTPLTKVEDSKKQYLEDGIVYQKFGNHCWYTNLEHKRHKTPIPDSEMADEYDSKKYPKYDNYDAIEVGNVKNIPKDYKGIMGVPITFLDKYCPEQFEIIGTDSADFAKELGIQPIGNKWVEDYRKIGGTGHYTSGMRNLVYYDKGTPKKCFARIFIKRK